MIRIYFLWPELPDYAARCIRAVIERQLTDEIVVIGTRPRVPIEGMEHSLGRQVHWIDGHAKLSWHDLGIPPPDVMFQGGYFLPAFNSLGEDCRKQGGKVILNSDQNWTGSFRQRTLDPVHQRLFLRSRFSAVFAAGSSGLNYYRNIGFKNVAAGLLGADPTLFEGGRPLTERPRCFLFVGRLIALKNVSCLTEAFLNIHHRFPDWTLKLVGDGPVGTCLPQHPAIERISYLQPDALSTHYKSARCLVLPSKWDHWGLVVHEAALSGCALALSRTVGAAADLARPENALLFEPGDSAAIARALAQFAGWSDEQWAAAEHASRQLASAFGPNAFADGVERLAGQLGARSLS